MHGKNPIMGFSTTLFIFAFIFSSCSCSDEHYDINGTLHTTFLYASFRVSKTKLNPYDWRYIRVELPPFLSSGSIQLDTDVNIDLKAIHNHDEIKLPMICVRDGGPPLPDFSNAALKGLVLNHFHNGSVGGIQYVQSGEQCYPLQKNITFTFAYGQITPGIYYVGLFNGIGPTRTQSKMINRGSAYSFSANITVESCSTMRGKNCDREVDELPCRQSDPVVRESNNQLAGSVAVCWNSSEPSCHENMKQNFYSLNVMEAAEQLMISTSNFRFLQAPSTVNGWDDSEIALMCYARYNAIADKNLHDYSTELSTGPLDIQSPRSGTWYLTIQPVYRSNVSGGTRETNNKLCYLMEWEVHACPRGKVGSNCTWERHMLQAVPMKNPTVPLIYLPDTLNMASANANFPLEPLLSKSFRGDKSDYAWTYFHLVSSRGAAGKNVHIQLLCDTKIIFELYVRFNGLPSLDMWDYHYSNQTGNSNNSSMFKLYDTNQEKVNLYILYAKEGPWTIGLRHPVSSPGPSMSHTTMSVSIKSCPNKCSDHGTCEYQGGENGLASYSYCSCDRNHGGFDCGVEMVSREGQRCHSISIIASNAAAILPAFWALRQKAVAEWVIFMSSGISSALYHACDVGSWCALSFHVLQFMDFWLSFMAVVSTFLYLTNLSEAAKRAIHTIIAIITVLLAINGPTRPRNVVIVLAIGALGLLVGWLLEFCSQYKKPFKFPPESNFNISERCKKIQRWFLNQSKVLYEHFRCRFVLLGLIALSLAGISWKLENSETYWIWHSLWHVTIYTCSFFFLCSKADASYELAQQNSIP